MKAYTIQIENTSKDRTITDTIQKILYTLESNGKASTFNRQEIPMLLEYAQESIREYIPEEFISDIKTTITQVDIEE